MKLLITGEVTGIFTLLYFSCAEAERKKRATVKNSAHTFLIIIMVDCCSGLLDYFITISVVTNTSLLILTLTLYMPLLNLLITGKSNSFVPFETLTAVS